MLCRPSRGQVPRAAPFCPSCGRPTGRAAEDVAFEVVLPDGRRVPLEGELTVGRGSENPICIDDRTVSRVHLRLGAGAGAAWAEDAGSSHGTLLDDEPLGERAVLRDGAELRLGDVRLRVERRREVHEAGRTIVVPAADVAAAAGVLPEVAAMTASFGTRPRLRPGYALKRLDATEGEQRFVLRDLDGSRFLRLGAVEAALVERLDGRTGLAELAADASFRFGAPGRAALPRLLADLAERGWLEGIDAAPRPVAQGRAARALTARSWPLAHAPDRIQRLYRGGGWVLFTRPVLLALAVVGVAGAAAFAYLTLGRYGTPFVVASKVGLGGLVFLVGRLALVAFHELAHGLTLASFGRPVRSAGLKLMLIFPFAYVDSSLVHDLPRQRRVAVSIAGPASDFVLGGTFALLSFAAAGTVRDVLFQLALAGYVGALFNLNPLLDRDGYHVLSDLLGEDDLRGRSRLWLERRLRGEPTGEGGRRLAVYAIAGLVWMVGALGFVVVLSLVAYERLSALLPEPIVLAALAILYVLLLVPVGLVVVRPLWSRTRRRPAAEAMDG